MNKMVSGLALLLVFQSLGQCLGIDLDLELKSYASSTSQCEDQFTSLFQNLSAGKVHKQSTVSQLLEDSLNPGIGATLKLDHWNTLSPFWYEKRTPTTVNTLDEIQELVKSEGGLTTLVDAVEPLTEGEKKRDLLYYGSTHILYAKSLEASPPSQPIDVPGVMIIPSWPGSEVRLRNIMGKLLQEKRFKNPPKLILDEGYGHLEGLLLDRTVENKLGNEILEQVMPQGETFSDLMNHGLIQKKSFENGRRTLQKKIDAFLKGRNTHLHTPQLEQQLTELIEKFMKGVKEHFPRGAFIKNFGEFATGDAGTQIRSDQYDAVKIAQSFLKSLKNTKASDRTFTEGISDSEFQLLMRPIEGQTASPFLLKLITKPDDILIQEKMEIVKTAWGYPMEFRASVRHGVCVAVWMRHSFFEYYGEYYPAVKELIQNFFSKAPPEVKQLSGGFDVIFVKDPTKQTVVPKIIEFNAGPADGFLLPKTLPLETNVAKSNIMGKPSPLIALLQDAHSRGPGAEVDFMKHLKKGIEIPYKSSMNDFSVEEAFRYFRSLYLQDFDKTQKSPKDVQATLDQLNSLLKPELFKIESNPGKSVELMDDLKLYIRGAKDYLERNKSQ